MNLKATSAKHRILVIDYTLFYSWQMDADVACNKDFIREALKSAINGRADVPDAPRFESGMEGTAGSPEVATEMFEKIQGCAIFVADATLVGRIISMSTGKKDEKKTINPNVAVEMGFAAAHTGWSRIICVMNEAEDFGSRRELPFDVRNRRFPIDYSLSPSQAKDSTLREEVLKGLVKDFRRAIDVVEKNELRKAAAVRAKLDLQCLKLMALAAPFASFPEPEAKTIAQFPALGGMPSDQFHTAAVRLLELSVLRADAQPQRKLYAYHWTYLGKMLLKDFGLA